MTLKTKALSISVLITMFVTLLSGGAVSAQNREEISSRGLVPLKLYAFECGKILVRDISLFNPLLEKGQEKNLANPCFLIQHPKGTLMWDAGLPDGLIGMPDGLDVFNGGIHLSVTKTLKSQMSEIDMKPEDIDFLVLSHLHNDHTGNAGYFTQSTWLIQDVEYKIAFSQNAEQYGFTPKDYSKLQSNPVKKLRGNFDVFGDGSVVIISTPGHSPGHQSLFVDLPKTGPVMLSGDLYHFQENRESYGIPIWNSKKETIHSFVLMDNLLEKTKAPLWIQHDQVQFNQLKLAPAFYE